MKTAQKSHRQNELWAAKTNCGLCPQRWMISDQTVAEYRQNSNDLVMERNDD